MLHWFFKHSFLVLLKICPKFHSYYPHHIFGSPAEVLQILQSLAVSASKRSSVHKFSGLHLPFPATQVPWPLKTPLQINPPTSLCSLQYRLSQWAFFSHGAKSWASSKGTFSAARCWCIRGTSAGESRLLSQGWHHYLCLPTRIRTYVNVLPIL